MILLHPRILQACRRHRRQRLEPLRQLRPALPFTMFPCRASEVLSPNGCSNQRSPFRITMFPLTLIWIRCATMMTPFFVLFLFLFSQILKLRTRFNKSLEKDGVKLSVNDFVIKATAMASRKVPEANSAWMGTFIRM